MIDTLTSRIERRYDFDWLRIIAVLALIPLHSAAIFSGTADIVNTETNDLFLILLYLIDLWQMPLLFLVSGAATWFVLSRYIEETFIYRRTLRLIVPLLTATLVILIPIEYFERVFNGQFEGSFLSFVPALLTETGALPIGKGHLWFLLDLFLFSVVCLPLFSWLQSKPAQAMIGRWAERAQNFGVLLLGALPLMLSQFLLRFYFPTANRSDLFSDWANITFWITIFIYGYILASSERLSEAAAKYRWISLILTIVTIGAFFTTFATYRDNTFLAAGMLWAISAFGTYNALLAFVGFGYKHLNRPHDQLSEMTDMVLPFYIFHQLAIAGLAFFIVPTDLHIGVKYLLIAFGALIITLLLIQPIRRYNLTRVLFGMGTRRPTSIQQSSSSARDASAEHPTP